MGAEFQEKTQQATPRRREEARKRGQVVRSRELSSAAMVLGGLWGLSWLGPELIRDMGRFMVHYWRNFPSTILTEQDLQALILQGIRQGLIVLAPLLLLLTAVGVAASAGQYRLVFTSSPLQMDWNRINPFSGVKRIFSLKALFESAKVLLKFLIIGVVCYWVIGGHIEDIAITLHAIPAEILRIFGDIAFDLGLWTGVAVALLGGVDYGYQLWQHEKELRMTRQEMMEEVKEHEGNPAVRSRIRSIQRDVSRKRMMADVPKADVVITNPTSLAVALLYRQGEMGAPKVVAKGAGLIAERIREIAKRNGVPTIENKPLAQALFRGVDIGESIPSRFYRAVAEVLAYVYRIRGKTL